MKVYEAMSESKNPFVRHCCFQLCWGSTFSTQFLFQLVWRSTGTERYLILFLVKFPVDCRQNHVWGCIVDPSYDNIYKNMYFAKVELGDNHG